MLLGFPFLRYCSNDIPYLVVLIYGKIDDVLLRNVLVSFGLLSSSGVYP